MPAVIIVIVAIAIPIFPWVSVFIWIPILMLVLVSMLVLVPMLVLLLVLVIVFRVVFWVVLSSMLRVVLWVMLSSMFRVVLWVVLSSMFCHSLVVGIIRLTMVSSFVLGLNTCSFSFFLINILKIDPFYTFRYIPSFAIDHLNYVYLDNTHNSDFAFCYHISIFINVLILIDNAFSALSAFSIFSFFRINILVVDPFYTFG